MKISEVIHKLSKSNVWINRIGAILVICSLCFLFLKFRNYIDSKTIEQVVTKQVFHFVILASIFHGLFCFFLAYGWHALLLSEKIDIPKHIVISIFTKTEIGKYIPGNVFQFLGRQLLANRYGYTHSQIAKSSLWSVLLHAFAALIVSILFFTIGWVENIFFKFSALIGWLIFFLSIWIRYQSIFKQRSNAFLLYCIFHICSSISFAALVFFLSNVDYSLNNYLFIMFAYLISWLVGFIVPGSPGGIGVRELVMFTLLSSSISQGFLLATLAISRLITILGDLVFFIAGLFTNMTPNTET